MYNRKNVTIDIENDIALKIFGDFDKNLKKIELKWIKRRAVDQRKWVGTKFWRECKNFTLYPKSNGKQLKDFYQECDMIRSEFSKCYFDCIVYDKYVYEFWTWWVWGGVWHPTGWSTGGHPELRRKSRVQKQVGERVQHKWNQEGGWNLLGEKVDKAKLSSILQTFIAHSVPRHILGTWATE